MSSKVMMGLIGWLLCGFVPGVVAQQAPENSRSVEPATTDAAVAEPDSGAIAQQAVDVAVKALERLESDPPPDEQAEALLAEVKASVELIRKHNPAHPLLPYLAGRAFALMGRGREAVEELRRFVETRQGRNDWRAHRLLGDLLVSQFARLAKTSYDRAMALKPDEPSVLLGRGRCLLRLGEIQEATALARQAVQADGGMDRAGMGYLSFLAGVLSTGGKWDEAERVGLAALRSAQASLSTTGGSAKYLLGLDARYRWLIELLKNRIASTDATSDDFLRLAGLLRERSANASALARFDILTILEAALEHAGETPSPRLLEEYGIVLSDVGRDEAATDAFQKLLKLEPDNAVAKTHFEKLDGDHGIAPDP
ncbi:MAG: tetratricopeptide repeat protein [Planctomycetes bacterium]|nr:tetratricopeptide repeat protein [Planctomycetota bacterium]